MATKPSNKRNLLAEVRDPYAAERADPNELTKQYPRLSGFLESALMGSAPDEMGSLLDPLTAERRVGAEYGFPIGTATQVIPGLSILRQALGAVPRTARNVARVVQGTSPREAILSELLRVNSPVERSASSSARGWVGPVSKGDMGSVGYPEPGVISAFIKPTTVGHTHPMTEGYRYAPLSPADKPMLRGRPVDMNVWHTYRETGKPTGWSESLPAGETPPQLSGPTEVSDYMSRLEQVPGYTTDVPRSMRPNGIMEQPTDEGLRAVSPVEKLRAKMLSALRPIEGVDSSIFEALKEGEKAPSGLSALARHYKNSIEMPTFPYPVYHGTTKVHSGGLKPYSQSGDDVSSWRGERRDPRGLAYAAVDPGVASHYAHGIYGGVERPVLHAYVGQNLPTLNVSDFSKQVDDDLFKSFTRLDYEELAKTLGILNDRLEHANPRVLQQVVKSHLRGDLEGMTHPNYDKLFEKINEARAEHISTLPENYIQNMNDFAGYTKAGNAIQKRMPQVMLTNPEAAIRNEQLIPLKGKYAEGGLVSSPANYATGGLVDDSISGYNPARVDEIVNQLRTELFQ